MLLIRKLWDGQFLDNIVSTPLPFLLREGRDLGGGGSASYQIFKKRGVIGSPFFEVVAGKVGDDPFRGGGQFLHKK